MFCAHAKILMADGTKREIRNINVGDMVISHTGYSRQVLAVKGTSYSGNMIKFDAGGGNWVTCTEGSKFFFTVTGKNIYQSSVGSTRHRDKIIAIPFPSSRLIKKLKKVGSIYWIADAVRLKECHFRPSKNDMVYNLDVEEEHTFVVVGYSGSIVIPTKGQSCFDYQPS